MYFADSSSKSANYCFPSPSKTTGLMLLSDVALGSPHELLSADYNAQNLPKGKHSVKGLGKMAPDSSKACTMSVLNLTHLLPFFFKDFVHSFFCLSDISLSLSSFFSLLFFPLSLSLFVPLSLSLSLSVCLSVSLSLFLCLSLSLSLSLFLPPSLSLPSFLSHTGLMVALFLWVPWLTLVWPIQAATP